MKKSLSSISILLWVLLLTSCNSNQPTNTRAIAPQPVPEVKGIFINGDTLHYIDIGKGDPVVFVHGTLGDYRAWGAELDTFSKNHRIIAYSRRFAYPNKQVINDSADYTVTPHATDLAELIKALKLEKVHLVGHSYGAFTALLTTLQNPELVRSLTLGEPPVMSLLANVPGGDTILSNFASRATLPAAAAFKNNNNEQAVNAFISGVMYDSSFFSGLPQPIREIMMQNTLELRGVALTKDLFPAVSCDDLKKAKTPVLLLQGDKSPLVFTSVISELDRCLTNKQKAVVANASHGLQFENPSEFNRIVLGFIDSH